MPVMRMRCSPASSSTAHMAGDTTAEPQFGTMIARNPRVGTLPRPASQPSTRGRLSGSWSSWPLHTSNQRAVSRTLRVKHPVVVVRLPFEAPGPRGIRPYVAFKPTSPVKPAGMRIEPPPSPPVAMETKPPATAAALPPDDPPGVRPCCHGLCVAPCNNVRVRFTPPNSLEVV